MSARSFTGLNILVVSPNEWGDMRVSKHHYAVALAMRGNRVFFLNPPNRSAAQRLKVEAVEGVEDLQTITYRPFVPYALRFHSRALYNRIAAAHVRWLMRTIGTPIDVVWCFDSNLYADLRWFGASLALFHPVDQVLQRHQADVAANADLVLSVSDEILRYTDRHGTPQRRIEHGLAPEFVALAERRSEGDSSRVCAKLRVGYVGNLLMPYIDRSLMLRLIAEHTELEFHLWGPRNPRESNVGSDASTDGAAFVESLELLPNVVLHGSVPPAELAEQIADLDALLLCYSVERDPNRGCNSHKILEYLSTGRVVIANHVSDYVDKAGLIEMVATNEPEALPALFDAVLRNIDCYNDSAHRKRRLSYALDNSYSKQIDRIEEAVAELVPNWTPRTSVSL